MSSCSFKGEAWTILLIHRSSDTLQAHSYAAHAQVGANYFVLCDGKKFVIFETLSGPQSLPIVNVPVLEVDQSFFQLENILLPSRLEQNCQTSYDLKLKLCDTLGSSVEIQSGIYGMDSWAFRIFINGTDSTQNLKDTVPQIAEIDNQLKLMAQEFELKVAAGIAERDEDGRINARVKFSGVTKNSQAGMELLGIEKMSFSTDEKFLSSDPHNPTVFESTADFSVEKGTMVAPQLFGAAIPMDTGMKGDIFVTTRMYKLDQKILGTYSAHADYWYDLPSIGVMKAELDLIGPFSLALAK